MTPLRRGATTTRTTPVTVGSLSGAARLTVGGDHNLALRMDDIVQSRGLNGYGQPGDGITRRNTSVSVSGLSGVAQPTP